MSQGGARGCGEVGGAGDARPSRRACPSWRTGPRRRALPGSSGGCGPMGRDDCLLAAAGKRACGDFLLRVVSGLSLELSILGRRGCLPSAGEACRSETGALGVSVDQHPSESSIGPFGC